LRLVGRLRPGVSLEDAQRELNVVASHLATEYPDTNKAWQVKLRSLLDTYTGDIRPVLYALFAAVVMLLLIACTNVANLLLTKGTERRREFAVRVALGASRGRLVRQVLTESLVLSIIGGALGLLLAHWGTVLLLQMFPNNIANINIPKVESLPIDSTVMLFCLTASVVTGILFGLFPAFQVSGKDVISGLHESSTAFTASRSGKRMRNVLVMGEICLALVLVTGAGLTIRSYQRASATQLGFDPDHVLSFYITMPQHKYPDANARRNYFDRLMASVAVVPGVQKAAGISYLPLSSFSGALEFTIEGREFTEGPQPNAALNVATPGYFDAMRIPILSGRDFAITDGANAPGVGLVNRSFARKFFGDSDPIGHRLNVGTPTKPEWIQIVGVVGDVREEGLDIDIQPELYVAFAQSPSQFMAFTLKTGSDPYAILGDVRQAVWSVDKDQPIERVLSMDDGAGESLAVRRITTSVMTIFGSISMVLACIGIYGVIAFSVAQRTHEFGIRMALGAQQSQLLRLVLSEAVRLAAIGIVSGLALALVLSRFAQSIVYNVSPHDPLTFSSTAMLLCAVALLAALIPAFRASRLNPSVALRQE
jgi:putative ABC transport system permease protein